MFRSPSLENKDLMALYGGEREHFSVMNEDCGSEDYDLSLERSEEAKGARKVRRSLSLEIYGLQRESHVYFSNQEYYRRLEELKSTHLRNMAELERMYINQSRGENNGVIGGGENGGARLSVSSGPVRKLQRINSQEELDFQETSSGSDQSELSRDDSVGDLELDNPRGTHDLDQTFGREILLSPEEMTTQKQFRFQPKASFTTTQEKQSCQTRIRVRSNSKVTVPKPFQMMIREEERKKRRVRTRSEIELENTLLRQELEELRECQKQFRASPAPAHTHLPLYEIINRRPSQRSNRSRGNNNNNINKNNQALNGAASQPFHFIERERRKREAKIVAELGKQGSREGRQVFRARPMPTSVYGNRQKADNKTTRPQPQSLAWAQEREPTKSEPNSDEEPDVLIQSKTDMAPDTCRAQRCPYHKPVKKQLEVSIELVKER